MVTLSALKEPEELSTWSQKHAVGSPGQYGSNPHNVFLLNIILSYSLEGIILNGNMCKISNYIDLAGIDQSAY
jgi:hypothetical protein